MADTTLSGLDALVAITPANLLLYVVDLAEAEEADQSKKLLFATLKSYTDGLYQPVGDYLIDAPGDGTIYGRQDGAWVEAGGGAVDSVFGRTGAVVAASGDYTASQVTNAAAVNAANVFTAIQTFTTRYDLIHDGTKYLSSTIASSGNVVLALNGGVQVSLTGAVLSINRRFQCTGNTAPVTGAGLEFGGSGVFGTMLAFDRDATLYLDFILSGKTLDFRTGPTSTATTRLYVNSSGNVGIGANLTSPTARLHVDQHSTTGAIPVLILDQADVDEDFISFIGTSDSGSTDRSLIKPSDFSTPGSITAWLKCKVTDTRVGGIGTIDGWIPVYSAPTV